MNMGLGPQPFAQCTVWLTESPAAANAPAQQLRSSMRAKAAAAAAVRQQQAVHTAAVQDTRGGSSSTSSSAGDATNNSSTDASNTSSISGGTGSSTQSGTGSSSSGTTEEGTCSARQKVATWIVLPDSTPEGVAQRLQEIGKQKEVPQPREGGGASV